MAGDDTPLMQQWREVKSRHPDSLIFFRVGDFYELFNEDAEEGARLLDLTLTSRNNGSSRAPLAGVPVHALETYLLRLVRQGRRVAICEQVEDPSTAKGVVRRAVTETITPGTALSDSLLDARRNNYLLALGGDAGGAIGAAWADLSTGELTTRALEWGEIRDLLAELEPAELLLPLSWREADLPSSRAVCTPRGDWTFEPAHGRQELLRSLRVLTLEGYGLGPADGALVGACGALITYLSETQPVVAACLRPPTVVRGGRAMPLDAMTRRNLELVEPLRADGPGETLLRVLDTTLTPMGARLLRRSLLAPLVEVSAIRLRLDAVAELVDRREMRGELRLALAEVRDLERLAVKVGASRCSPRDLLAVRHSLLQVPRLSQALASASTPRLGEHRAGLDPLSELVELIGGAIQEDAPASVADGGVIRSGFDPELDSLRELRDGAVDWIARLQVQERIRTGIASLKVGFNRVFGYYIEVTRAHEQRVPPDYQRKQTLANAERYFTPELKEWEEKVTGAEERIRAVESRIFEEVRGRAASLTGRLQRLSDRVAALDVLAGLAETAVRREFVRPEVYDGYDLEIRGGRHPVVETMMAREEFIPNDVVLSGDDRVMILTGPNMAGKSTVLRQAGLIVLLAQMGSFVPARSARVGVVDRIFTRVGASDNLVHGQSTFMVEMTETAAILHGASQRSLVLLDEIGRGTSTWDGMSVATAVAEHLHDRIGAKTIFATHYHELTRLAQRLPGVVNFSVAVREEGDAIVFLRALVPGGADRSYGVEVARLAGLPPGVIERARTLLRELEQGPERFPEPRAGSDGAGEQLALFPADLHPALRRLRALDVERTTPLEALLLLDSLRREAGA